jgi:hypothetical protein
MATDGKFDLMDKAAMDATAPPSECPTVIRQMPDTYKFRTGVTHL